MDLVAVLFLQVFRFGVKHAGLRCFKFELNKGLKCRFRCKTTCIKYISYSQVIDTRDVFSNSDSIVWGVDAICCIMSNAPTVVVCQHKHPSSAPLNPSG